MQRPDHISAWASSHRLRFLSELKDFVRFPTVSAQPEYAPDMRRCADWLANHLSRVGLDRVRVIEGFGAPLVYADRMRAPGGPTLLFYGHYDVQPPDPLEQWETQPFVPSVRGQRLYGRGASDDKGQMFVHIKAMESWLRTMGELPVNVRCLYEGEEEIGSPGLGRFLDRYRGDLRSDVAIVSDTPMQGPGRPAVTYSLRGALSLEIEVRGPERDLHSGAFGGAVHNPLQALCEIIASCHDRAGRIAIDGFYDQVPEPDEAERKYMKQVGPSDTEVLRSAKVAQGWGDPGYTLYERIGLRPALTVNGVTGGYQQAGAKAVIPARASAKLNFRLAPAQDPFSVERLFRRHLARVVPKDVRMEIRPLMHARGAVVCRRHPMMRAAAIACRYGFGIPPIFLRSGGTIPIVSMLQAKLGVPPLLLGFALPDDGLHAPNESFHLPSFEKGIRTSISFLALAAGKN